MTEIGNAAVRVAQALAEDFEYCTENACKRLAPHCDSPIEVMIGATLALSMNLRKPNFLTLIPPGESVPEKYCFALYPQYQLEGYRFDFALIHKDQRWPRVLIECDGHDFHERTKEQAAHDRQKDRVAQTAGFAIMRFTGSEIYRDPAACCQQIANLYNAAIERAKTP